MKKNSLFLYIGIACSLGSVSCNDDDSNDNQGLIATDAPLTPEDRLKPGALVEITSGPLAGLEGKVLRRGKQLKFIVEVQFLQSGVSVEIESWMIEPKDNSAPIATVGA